MRFLLAHGSCLAPFEKVLGAFAKFPRFALGVIAAFIGLLREKFARFFTRLWRKQNPYERSNSETHQEEAYF